MINANRLDYTDFEGSEFAAAMADIEGEVQAAVDWVEDAFGGIEAEASQLAPVRAANAMIRAFFRRG